MPIEKPIRANKIIRQRKGAIIMANYQAMTNKQLQALCKEKGLSTSGSKPVLIARLNNLGATATVEEVTSEVREATEEISQYAINAMRKALISAHKLNNKKAITEDIAVSSGVSVEKLTEWKEKVESLRQVVMACNDVRHRESSTREQLVLAEGRIYPCWRDVCKCGMSETDKSFHGRWFIRQSDVASLIGFDEKFYATEVGTQMGHAPSSTFRKYVESLIGWRITGNDMLNDKDRDDLLEYEKAVKTIKTSDDRLNGFMKGDNHIKGLIEKIRDMENQIKSTEDILRSLGQNDNDIAESPIVASFKAQLSAFKKDKETVEKTKTKAEETVRKLKERAEQIYATLHLIEE